MRVAPDPVISAEAYATAEEQKQQKGDYFGMFYGLTNRTTPYTPLQEAASAVMGGFWSIFDAAYAVLNDEFDGNDRNPSSISIISDDSIEGRESASRIGETRSNTNSCHRGPAILLCGASPEAKFTLSSSCGHTKCTSRDGEHKAASDTTDDQRSARRVTANNVNEISIERFPSQNMEYFTPQNSLTGSISALQLLYEGGSGKISLDLSMDYGVKRKNTDNRHDLFSDLIDEDEMNEWEDSEYCIIRDAKETNDGWMVLSDD